MRCFAAQSRGGRTEVGVSQSSLEAAEVGGRAAGGVRMEEAPRPAAQLSVAGLEGLRGREAGPGAAGMPGADVEYCVGKGFCTNRCWLQGRVRQVQPGRVSG